MLLLPDAWTWDCWFVDDGSRFHAFYLKASRALIDPQRRHLHASVGHAISDDLVAWTEQPDVLVADDDPSAFDHVAIWTGSIVRDSSNGWRLFYTGRAATHPQERQRIGSAVSADLVTWHRDPAFAPLEADPRWYEVWGDSSWGDEAWRDPWVFADPGGNGWHMLITARLRAGAVDDRGTLGHARSDDLVTWHVQPPLSAAAGFAQLEVPQLFELDGRWYVVFSCLTPELRRDRRDRYPDAGMWIAPVESPLGPYDLTAAVPLSDATRYAGKVLTDRKGRLRLLAFANTPEGSFVGGISDPAPIDLPATPVCTANRQDGPGRGKGGRDCLGV
jgi:beta-fructofuranosidase